MSAPPPLLPHMAPSAVDLTRAGGGFELESHAEERTRIGGWFDAVAQRWLVALNTALGVFIGGALAAPMLMAAGLTDAATSLYGLYHLTCHQWAFRSFFLFGESDAPILTPLAIYSPEGLARRGLDPFGFLGNAALGWKMAICERDIAIYAALLLVSLIYANRGGALPALHPLAFVALALPMAIDGVTQLVGWRESTWELRVLTGSLFGIGCAWFVLPTLDAMMRRDARHGQPDHAEVLCRPAPG